MSDEQVVQTDLQKNQVPTQPVVVDERPLPKILVKQIEDGQARLAQVQQQIQRDITEATQEVMEMLGLANEEGWFLDMDRLRFVKVIQAPQAQQQQAPEPVEEVSEEE